MKYKMIDEKLKSLNKHFKHPSYALEQMIHSYIQNGMLEEAIEAQQQFCIWKDQCLQQIN